MAWLAVTDIENVEQDWRAAAACAGRDPEIFFAGDSGNNRVAKSVCRECPVRGRCLQYAMEAPMDHGIWGGLTVRERRSAARLAGMRSAARRRRAFGAR